MRCPLSSAAYAGGPGNWSLSISGTWPSLRCQLYCLSCERQSFPRILVTKQHNFIYSSDLPL